MDFCDSFHNLHIFVRLVTASHQFGYSALHVVMGQEEIDKLQKKQKELQGESHNHDEDSLLPKQIATSPKKSLTKPRYQELEIPEHICQFSMSQIRKATRNFHSENLIGEGGYGPVYRGDLGGMHVAIKLLRPHGRQGYPEYRHEVIPNI